MRRGLFLVGVVALLVALAAVAAVANESANAHHIQWTERSDVIHIFVFDDDGREGHPPAVVSGRSPVYFGYELEDVTVEVLQSSWLDNPDHDILVSINDGPDISLKHLYQEPFLAVPGEGPRWSWDHDGDGLGNNNSIADDWDGPIMFWRYSVKQLEKGTHTFRFTFVNRPEDDLTDLVTVEAG